MQVNQVYTSGATTASGGAQALLLPDILQLLRVDPDAAARQEQTRTQRDSKLRRRDTDEQDLLAAVSSSQRARDSVIRAERNMLPGSQAARREMQQEQAQARSERGAGEFRAALADAAARGKTPANQAAQAGNADQTKGGKAEATPGGEQVSDKPAAARTAPAANDAGSTVKGGAVQGPAAVMSRVVAPAAMAAATPTTTNTTGAEAQAVKALGSAARVSSVSSAAASASTSSAKAGSPATSPVAATIGAQRTGGNGARAAKVAATPGEQQAESTSDANTERILRLINARIGKDRSVATLRLDPPELGKMKLHMDLRENQLALRIDVETDAARRLLTEQADALRRSLESTGIHLERIEVRVPEAVATDAAGSGTLHTDVPSHGEYGTAQGQTESAGGGHQAGREADDTEPMETAGAGVAVEPAAESLVNIWA